MNTLVQEGLRRATSRLARTENLSARIITRPTTPDELWTLVKDLWNVEIPRVHVCRGSGRPCNCAPFDAFSDAYFAKDPIAVWHASRGFGGKSFMLAVLSLTEAVVEQAKVNLLGGSGEQAERVLNYMYGTEVADVMWDHSRSPKHLVDGGYEKGSLKKKTDLIHGGYIRALMASSRSVRGPHPERLRLDEADEMDLEIFNAAMGQPMALRDIPTQVVASSTWHNANGTMTEILDRAEKRGWPVYRWCFRENMESNGGWLPDKEVETKRTVVTSTMFDVEYELAEPNPESRAIDSGAVKAMFSDEYGEYEGKDGEEIEVELPVPGAAYYAGTDWAKRSDYTVTVIFRKIRDQKEDDDDTHGPILKLVRFKRSRRRPWPVLVAGMEGPVRRFGKKSDCYSAHDETGIGDVISDYMSDDIDSLGIWMSGRLRFEILTDYIAAIEHGWLIAPVIKEMRKQHLHASIDDVFGSGHLPDTIAAGALAYYIYKHQPKRKKVRATWGR